MGKKPDPRSTDAAYAGRWVAKIRGRIVAQGSTPEAAMRAAQGNRHKEKPQVTFVPSSSYAILPRVLEKIADLEPDRRVYLVGGAVRDMLLDVVSHDFDLVVQQDAISFARRAADMLQADFYVLDGSFDAARVILGPRNRVRDVLDFTSLRGLDIQANLAARDFTINAIALDLRSRQALDPLHGASDIRAKLLRTCSETAMRDDPIRVLRGIRLAESLGFKIEGPTKNRMKEAAALLGSSSAERQRDEVFRILEGAHPDASFRALEMLGAVEFILPELVELKGLSQSAPHVFDGWEHTLAVMRGLSEIWQMLLGQGPTQKSDLLAGLLMLGIGRYRSQLEAHYSHPLNPDRSPRALLQLAALFHDVGKPSTRTVDQNGRIHYHRHEIEGARAAAERLRKWNLSTNEIGRVETVVRSHLRLMYLANQEELHGEHPSRRAIYRFFRASGDAAVDAILLGLADLQGTRGHTLTEAAWSAWVRVARELMENLWERPAEIVSPPRLIDGDVLMRALSLEPGPIVGSLLDAIREAQAVGEVSTREEALQFGADWLRATKGSEAK